MILGITGTPPYPHSHTTKERSVHIRGVGRNFSMGGRFKCYFLKGYFCTDLDPNTLYKKCIKFAPRNGGGGRPTPPPPHFLRLCIKQGIVYINFLQNPKIRACRAGLIVYKTQRYLHAGSYPQKHYGYDRMYRNKSKDIDQFSARPKILTKLHAD